MQEITECDCSNKLLLVDGSNLLFQMFYGMPARIIGKNGKAIHGTLGFVGALLKIIRSINPTHVFVVFDGETENERCTIDACYKANRPDYSLMNEEDVPFSQLPDIFAALDYLNIRFCETTDCEADDIIASYCLSYGEKVSVIVSSFDSDFFQLITDKVSVLRYRGENTVVYNPSVLFEKLGIMPNQYADFKSLIGDNADNIKGVKNIGPKTAAKLLNQFGTLDKLLNNANEIVKEPLRKTIIENYDLIRKNYQLIKLGNAVTLPFALNEMSFCASDITTSQVLKHLGLK